LNAGLTDPTMPEIYVPFTTTGASSLLVVRTHGDPAGVTRSVVAQVYAIDRGQPVTDVETLERVLQEEAYATPRFNLVLISIFAAIGLALVVVGVYGVLSSAVAQERQEIGIRVALGAGGATIARMVIGRGLRLLLTGIAIGLAGSLAAGRLLTGAIWGISAFDPPAFAAVATVLLSVGIAACAIPARRAMRVDPIGALRQE
jgi:putative ABC transport system permease protein